MKIREWGEQVGQAILDGVGRVASRVQERKPLPADLLESDEAFVAVFDAPGAELEDVQVRFDEGTIRVRIDRYRDLYEDFEMRFPGRGLTLEGEIDLPEGVSVEPKKSDATLARNGTLRVEIPKDDEAVDIEPREEVDTREEIHGGDAGADVDEERPGERTAEDVGEAVPPDGTAADVTEELPGEGEESLESETPDESDSEQP